MTKLELPELVSAPIGEGDIEGEELYWRLPPERPAGRGAVRGAARRRRGDDLSVGAEAERGALRFWTRMGFVLLRESVGEVRMERPV